MNSVSSVIQSPIFVAILAAVVSGGVATVFEVLVGARTKHNFDKQLQKMQYMHETELERLRAALGIDTEEQREVRARRYSLYPHIIEIAYRARNLARDEYKVVSSGNIATNDLERNPELLSLSKNLRDELFANRLDLTRDSVFESIHSYVRALMEFAQIIDDYLQLADRSSKEAESVHIQIDDSLDNTAGELFELFDKVLEGFTQSFVGSSHEQSVPAADRGSSR